MTYKSFSRVNGNTQSEPISLGFATDGHMVDPLSREALLVMKITPYAQNSYHVGFKEYPGPTDHIPLYMSEPARRRMLADIYESALPESALPQVEHSLWQYSEERAKEAVTRIAQTEAKLREQLPPQSRLTSNSAHPRYYNPWDPPGPTIGASI